MCAKRDSSCARPLLVCCTPMTLILGRSYANFQHWRELEVAATWETTMLDLEWFGFGNAGMKWIRCADLNQLISLKRNWWVLASWWNFVTRTKETFISGRWSNRSQETPYRFVRDMDAKTLCNDGFGPDVCDRDDQSAFVQVMTAVA